MKNLALKLFRTPPSYLNCAQAVAGAWHQTTGRNGELVNDLRSCGGGRAPGGVCGALHAAQLAAGDDAAGRTIAGQFAKAVGALSCREIRTRGSVSCGECVAVATELLSSVPEKRTTTT